MIKNRNKMWAEFGYGDILVGNMMCVDNDNTVVGVLTLENSDEPYEIGASVQRKEDIDLLNVPIIMSFKDIRSLDIVIDHLNQIRIKMKDFEDARSAEEPDEN